MSDLKLGQVLTGTFDVGFPLGYPTLVVVNGTDGDSFPDVTFGRKGHAAAGYSNLGYTPQLHARLMWRGWEQFFDDSKVYMRAGADANYTFKYRLYGDYSALGGLPDGTDTDQGLLDVQRFTGGPVLAVGYRESSIVSAAASLETAETDFKAAEVALATAKTDVEAKIFDLKNVRDELQAELKANQPAFDAAKRLLDEARQNWDKAAAVLLSAQTSVVAGLLNADVLPGLQTTANDAQASYDASLAAYNVKNEVKKDDEIRQKLQALDKAEAKDLPGLEAISTKTEYETLVYEKLQADNEVEAKQAALNTAKTNKDNAETDLKDAQTGLQYVGVNGSYHFLGKNTVTPVASDGVQTGTGLAQDIDWPVRSLWFSLEAAFGLVPTSPIGFHAEVSAEVILPNHDQSGVSIPGEGDDMQHSNLQAPPKTILSARIGIAF